MKDIQQKNFSEEKTENAPAEASVEDSQAKIVEALTKGLGEDNVHVEQEDGHTVAVLSIGGKTVHLPIVDEDALNAAVEADEQSEANASTGDAKEAVDDIEEAVEDAEKSITELGDEELIEKIDDIGKEVEQLDDLIEEKGEAGEDVSDEIEAREAKEDEASNFSRELERRGIMHNFSTKRDFNFSEGEEAQAPAESENEDQMDQLKESGDETSIDRFVQDEKEDKTSDNRYIAQHEAVNTGISVLIDDVPQVTVADLERGDEVLTPAGEEAVVVDDVHEGDEDVKIKVKDFSAIISVPISEMANFCVRASVKSLYNFSDNMDDAYAPKNQLDPTEPEEATSDEGTSIIGNKKNEELATTREDSSIGEDEYDFSKMTDEEIGKLVREQINFDAQAQAPQVDTAPVTAAEAVAIAKNEIEKQKNDIANRAANQVFETLQGQQPTGAEGDPNAVATDPNAQDPNAAAAPQAEPQADPNAQAQVQQTAPVAPVAPQVDPVQVNHSRLINGGFNPTNNPMLNQAKNFSTKGSYGGDLYSMYKRGRQAL